MVHIARLNIVKNTDPFRLFGEWYEGACQSEINDPDAASLATASAEGIPNVRMVLVKGMGHEGFTFFTNIDSDKGRELAENPHAALCFHWKSLGRQVRMQGPVHLVSPEDADAYFSTRHPASRRGAIASLQSREMVSFEAFEKAISEVERQYPDDDLIPRPPHWSGFRLQPTRIEFWQQGLNRLHDRFIFIRKTPAGLWTVLRLYP